MIRNFGENTGITSQPTGLNIGLNNITDQQYLDMERRAVNGEAIADITNRTTGAVDFFYDLFDNTNDHSCGIMDTTKTTITVPTIVGETVLDPHVASITGFAVGQEVTVQQIEDDGVTETKEYATVTRAETVEESTVIDRSTPVQIVASAYTTSKDARPQRLSNGWWVTVEVNTNISYFQVSKDNGANYEPLCFLSTGTVVSFSIASKGTMIYYLFTVGGVAYLKTFDANTVTNVEQNGTLAQIDTQSSYGTGCSLTIDSTGTYLHETHCSKNATYPDSFNIRYAKGTISAVDGSVTWGSVEQVTTRNSSGIDFLSPCITSNGDIVVNETSYNVIMFLTKSFTTKAFDGSFINVNWGNVLVYNGGSYAQSSPDIIRSIENGILFCSWNGTDATDGANQIRFAKSIDGGVTWTKMDGTAGHDKLTNVVNDPQYRPSITVDNNNNIYIMFYGIDSTISTGYYNIRKIIYNTGWSAVTSLTTISSGSAGAYYPSTCSNYQNFTDPICIYQDNQALAVKFRGIFSTTTQVPHLEVTALQNAYKVNARVYRSLGNVDTVNKRLGFSEGFLDSTTYDRSTPTTVVASAFDTSGNGGRKLVRLSNGWLVAIAHSVGTTYIYVDKRDEYGFVPLCTIGASIASPNIALASIGTNIYVLRNANTAVYSWTINCLTQTNVDINASKVTADTGQNEMGSGCSIEADSLGYLYATWCSKNATYPNSFNIRFSKSIDEGVTWSAVTQITSENNVSKQITNPCIIIQNNYPKICYQFANSTTENSIRIDKFNGTIWSTTIIYDGISYTQTNPSLVVKKYGSNIGRIWTGWHGLDSTDTTKQNIRVSYSDDSGATWSTAVKITTGNTVDRKNISLTEDVSGNVYAVYEDNGTLVYQVCTNGTTTFGGLTSIGIGTNASALDNSSGLSFSKPLVVYMSASTVKFFGLWVVGGYILFLEEDIRYNITPSEAVSQIVDWMQYNIDNGFSIDNKFSLVATGNAESYGNPTLKTTIIEAGVTAEDQNVYIAPANSRITKRLTLSRNVNTLEKYITKILGSVGND